MPSNSSGSMSTKTKECSFNPQEQERDSSSWRWDDAGRPKKSRNRRKKAAAEEAQQQEKQRSARTHSQERQGCEASHLEMKEPSIVRCTMCGVVLKTHRVGWCPRCDAYAETQTQFEWEVVGHGLCPRCGSELEMESKYQ